MTRISLGAVAVLVVFQGVATGQWALGALAALGCCALWLVPTLRHGVGSFALGGAGMAIGGWGDALLGLGASCHDAGFWSLSTLGMVLGCTVACVVVCRLGGASGLNPVFHGITLVGMFTCEQLMVVAMALVGHQADHWFLTLGMALGAGVGALTAGLSQPLSK